MAEKAKCNACNTAFEDKEEIIGCTNATVSDADDAIIPDDQPWLTLFHQECWELVWLAVKVQVKNAAMGTPIREAANDEQRLRDSSEASVAQADEAD